MFFPDCRYIFRFCEVLVVSDTQTYILWNSVFWLCPALKIYKLHIKPDIVTQISVFDICNV